MCISLLVCTLTAGEIGGGFILGMLEEQFFVHELHLF